MNRHQPATSLKTPPDCVPDAGPVNTVCSVLPFGELTWENFERLCHRLASQDDEVEHCERYGRTGQAQQGIDIFARKKNENYDTWQVKRYKTYSSTNLQTAIQTFLKGNWVAKTETLFVAVQATLSDTKVQDAIEVQTKHLKSHDVLLVVLGGEQLSERLRDYPQLVLDFFGRQWTKAFFGDSVDQRLLDTLDGAEIARVRAQLARVYQTQFQQLDRGVIENNDFSNGPDLAQERGLLARFTRPDMLVRDFRDAISQPRNIEKSGNVSQDNLKQHDAGYSDKSVERSRRIPLVGWLTQSDQLALLGDAGTGKSTVLRCLALDLIGEQGVLPEIASRWGSLIPVYVSFAKWARTAENAGGQIGLKDVVRVSLQPLLTADLIGLLDRAIDEHRILLLVDGLDEWSNEQAARTSLQTLLTFVATHQIPTVITARPRGLNRVGSIPRSWSTGTLAPLSADQQRRLVLRCLGQTIPEEASPSALPDPSLNQRAERFFRELQREAGLSTLAEIPLLLVSLLVLSLRRITLPRKRAQALDLLIDILLETHPQGRATAAGDVQPRFRIVQDIDIRKGAVAALAYASRQEGGDAGYPTSTAKNKIRDFLTDPDTHAFGREKATEAANEILAVNAETIGLLVEKGPSEVGFVHASLEEYLAALHIQSWELEELVHFVSTNATNVRWRNVISNLIAITKRPAEIDQLVAAIESAETDVLGESTRNQLLTDIAFAPSKMSPATATRLGQKSLSLIEFPSATGERMALLSSALNGTSHPVIGPILLERVRSWAPKTLDYSENFFEVLGTWDRAPDLLSALKSGLIEQSRWGSQRSAARAMAKVYGGCEDVRQWLLNILNGTTNFQSTSAAIEALVLGWPSTEGFEQIIADASSSLKSSLRSIAIWASVKLKRHDERQLFQLLELLEESQHLDYLDKSLAWEALSSAWLNHPIVIECCLQVVGHRHRTDSWTLDREKSTRLLLDCSPKNKSICKWIIDELKSDYPFSSIHGNWDCLIPFALADDAIKESLVATITDKKNEGLDYQIYGLIANLNDHRLKIFAIHKMRDLSSTWSYFGCLQALIKGWASDQDVVNLLDEIRTWPNHRLVSLGRLLPKILPDRKECRSRLLALQRTQKSHLMRSFPTVFAEIGCDSTDQEVVDALINTAKSNRTWGGSESLICNFGANPSVQSFARD